MKTKRRITRTLSATTVVLLLVGCGEPLAPPAPPPFYAMLSTGGDHTCGLTTESVAYCWGFGSDGALGTGRATSSDTPVPVQSPVAFSAITAGYRHTCALSAQGQAFCWGWDRYGQLGDGGAQPSRLSPTPVAGDLRFSALSAGRYHTCGVTFDGSAYCWGYNGEGELGDGTFAYASVPKPVAGSNVFEEISAGGYHTCALDVTGRAYCWGLSSLGQLGIGDAEGSPVPTPVLGGHVFRSISAGYTHTCAVTAGGVAYCWGSNLLGELGLGFAGSSGGSGIDRPAAVRQQVWGGLSFTAISAGQTFTCAISGGDIYCWGRGYENQLGNGVTIIRTLARPAWPRPRSEFTTIAAGKAPFACALGTRGVAYCWGTGEEGQLGMGGERVAEVPTRISGG